MYVREGVGPQGLRQTAVVARQTLEDEQTVAGVYASRRVQQVGGRGAALKAVGRSGQPWVIVTVEKTHTCQYEVVTTSTAETWIFGNAVYKNLSSQDRHISLYKSQNIHTRGALHFYVFLRDRIPVLSLGLSMHFLN